MKNFFMPTLFAFLLSACGGGLTSVQKSKLLQSAGSAEKNTIIIHHHGSGALPLRIIKNFDWMGEVVIPAGGTRAIKINDGDNFIEARKHFVGETKSITVKVNSNTGSKHFVFGAIHFTGMHLAPISAGQMRRIAEGTFDVAGYFKANKNQLRRSEAEAETEALMAKANLKDREKKEKNKNTCLSYGFQTGTEAFANCLMQQDIAAKQSAQMARLRAQAASAQRKAEEAEKEASRASTQAIISNTIANQAKRDANTIPYGKDCPWLSGCKK
jgi:hypothetical protein